MKRLALVSACVAVVAIVATYVVGLHKPPPEIAAPKAQPKAAAKQEEPNALAVVPSLSKGGDLVVKETPVRPSSPSTVRADFEKSSDLKAFFDKHAGNWRQADPETKYYLSRTLSYCVDFIGKDLDSSPRPPIIADAQKSNPNFPQRSAALDRLSRECGGFSKYQPEEGMQAELLARSASAKYPAATAAKLVDLVREGKSAEATAQAQGLLATAPLDAETANGFANYLGGQMANVRVGSPPYQPEAVVYADAWRLALCDLGADCSQSSRRLNLVCLYFGACGAQSYDDYLRTQKLSQQQYEEVTRIKEQLVQGIKSRDLAMLGLRKTP